MLVDSCELAEDIDTARAQRAVERCEQDLSGLDRDPEAARIARMAQDGGASALLVFPPGVFTFGQRAEMAVEHFRRIADASDLPIILFQYPLAGGQGYPLATLLEILDAGGLVAWAKRKMAS